MRGLVQEIVSGVQEVPWLARRYTPSVFSWENYRLIFDAVFWLMLVLTYVGYMIVLVGNYAQVSAGHDMLVFGPLGITLSFAAVALLWHLLPWDLATTSRLRLLAIPLFLASLFWVNFAMVGIDRLFYWPLFLLAFGQGVFLFGPKRGLLYAAGLLVAIFVYLEVAVGDTLAANVILIALLVPSVLFIVAACAAVLEATRRRGEAQALSVELGSANAELKEYADRVRELSVFEERTRMAREIHDSVGHHLVVVNVQLEAAGKLLDDDPGAAREQLEKAKTSSSGALTEVRRSVRALKPLAVEERSGTGALAALARGFEGAGPSVRFTVEGEERELPPEVELVLYRTLQEGLTNALKHSGASRISAALTFEPTLVKIEVIDDGHGVPVGFEDAGFGLRSLSDRAASLGGSARSSNVEGGGFALEVELPTGLAGASR